MTGISEIVMATEKKMLLPGNKTNKQPKQGKNKGEIMERLSRSNLMVTNTI